MRRSAAITGIIAIIILASPLPALAASKATFLGPIVPVECNCKDQQVEGTGESITTAPDYGCVLQVVQNTINFGVTISTILFTLYAVLAGFGLITSRGNPESITKAKTRITNVLVGLAVLLCSWLIVDYVMKTLYDQGKFGPWNAILAGDSSGKDRCIVAKNPTAITTGAVDIVKGTEQGIGNTSSGGSYNGTGFTYQSGVQRQVPFESGALGSLLSCMATKVPAGVGQISAISENAIADGTKTMQQCASGQASCAHTTNSCHYGGRNCVGRSYAVDFGDENNANALRTAARSCNPNARYNYEGNHVHISVGAASGCQCDSGLSPI